MYIYAAEAVLDRSCWEEKEEPLKSIANEARNLVDKRIYEDAGDHWDQKGIPFADIADSPTEWLHLHSPERGDHEHLTAILNRLRPTLNEDGRAYFDLHFGDEHLGPTAIKKRLAWSQARTDAARKRVERLLDRKDYIKNHLPLSAGPSGASQFLYRELLDSEVRPGKPIHVHQHCPIGMKFPDGPPVIDGAGAKISWHNR
jgi:hypothetical protein